MKIACKLTKYKLGDDLPENAELLKVELEKIGNDLVQVFIYVEFENKA